MRVMGSIDRQFARFRRSGDAAALAQLFDATAPELLRVALYLCGDPQAAEDLVQGTFLVLIEDAASHDADRPVMPWLLGILANRARELRKARARTPDPERMARRVAGLQPNDPADDAARAEFEAAVARAVASMPSPYGEVLALHLMHGLTAKDIATALRRPAGTVRTQVVRAMEYLRAALPAGFASVAFVALAPGKGLAVVREVLLAKVAAKQVATASTMAAVGTIGGLMVMKTLLAAGGMIVLAALAWMAWPGSARATDTSSARHARAQTPTSEGGGPREATVESGRFDSAAGERRALVLEPAPATGALHVDLAWQDDHTPAANAYVSYRTQPGDGRPAEFGSARTDHLGATTFTALPAGPYLVRACETSEEEVVVESGKTTRASLHVRPDIVLDGIVVDPEGAPVAGAAVRSMTTEDLPTLTTSRSNGSFAWRGSYVSEVWAEKDGRAPSRSQVVRPDQGKPRTLRLVLGDEAPLLHGLVLDKNGQAAAHARVAISVDEATTRPALPDGQLGRHVPPVVVRADQSGRFATSSVPVGDHWLVASAEGSAPALQQVTVAAEAPEPIVVRLREGATLRGAVRDVAGRPLRATVRARAWHASSVPGLWPLGMLVMDAHSVTRTDIDGRYVLANLLPTQLDLECAAEGMVMLRLRIDLTQERESAWNPILGPQHAIAGRVVDADGRPLVGWVVKAQTEHRASQVQARTDAEGAFTLSGLGPTTYSVWAVPDTAQGAAASVHWGRAHAVSPGTKNLVLRTAWHAVGATFLAGRVMGTDGGRVTVARIKLYPKEGGGWDHDHESVIDDAEGRFRIGPLPAAEYRIDVSGAGHTALSLQRKLDAGQTLDLGPILLDPLGTLTVAARHSDGRKPTDLVMRLAYDGLAFADAFFSLHGDGTWKSPPWQPGRALLEVWGADVARVERAVEVAPGADVRVELILEPATPVRFLLVQPEPRTPSWNAHVRLTLRDATGIETAHGFRVDGRETFEWTRGLAPGHYDLAAILDGDGQSEAKGHFVVAARADGTQAPVEVRVTFPDRRPVPHPDGAGSGRGRRG